MNLTLARKWNSLGIPVIGMYLHQINSGLKFASKVEDIDDEILEGSNEPDYNCLALFISESNIVCLDVANKNDSVELFQEYLKDHGFKLSDFLYENTMNGGIHIFFRDKDFKKNTYRNDNNGISFDLLCQGRVFTSPTSYGEQKYTFGEKSPLDLNSLQEIGKMPKCIKELINESHYVPKLPKPVFL